MVPNKIPPRLKLRHTQLAFRRRSLPPLLLNTAATRSDYEQNAMEPLLVFGPDGAMFLPAGPPDQAQSPQLIPLASSLPDQAEPSSVAPQPPSSAPQGPSSVPGTSLSTLFRAQTTLDSVLSSPSSPPSSPPSPSASLTTDANPAATAPTQTPSASAGPTSPIQPSVPPTSSPSQSPTPRQSQSVTVTVTTSLTSPGASQSPSLTAQASGTLLRQSSLSPASTSASSATTSALASPSSTQTATNSATNSENLPHLAEIVLGVVAAISIVAIFATFISWFYKQRKRRNEHAEIVSLNSSAYDSGRGGIFGCLKKRRGKSTEDMSELGFGLSHVGLFGAPNSGDEDHRVGLALGPENVLSEEEERRYVYKDPEIELPLQPPRILFPSYGYDESAYPPMRPLRDPFPTLVDGASSMSVSPSRYQHLGGTSATPLTVANLAPGDVSGDEGGWEATGEAPLASRYGSLRTPRVGERTPRFGRLVEGEGLTIPWAPLNVKSHGTAEGNGKEEHPFQPLELSRTSTLSLAFSRTSSRRLGHSLSTATHWREGVTRPPQGAFVTALETNAGPEQDGNARESEQGTWATTIRNNFYNALNAMGSYGGKGRSNTSSVSTLPNPYSESSRHSSMRFPFSKPQRIRVDTLEDNLTLPPPRAARRSKGSIIRGNLGIEAPAAVGLGIDALSRSSTFSTSWSDAEKVSDAAWMAQHVRVLDRDMGRTHLVRTGTESTASSLSREVTTFHQMGRGRAPRALGKRPRYSRMPVSQSSVWSSESYSSSIRKGKVEALH